MAKKPIVDLDLFLKDRLGFAIDQQQKDFNQFVLNIIKSEVLDLNNDKQNSGLKVFTLGSLSYQGLCPYSDIDLLAVGDKNLAEELSKNLEKKLSNVKIKWWPELDFNLAVDIFDHISLFFAEALFATEGDEILNFKKDQWRWISENLGSYQENLFKDRKLRRSRYGNCGGELSPNLKYGPGGLRDLCQALAWSAWQQMAGLHLKKPEGASDALEKIQEDLAIGLQHIFRMRFALQVHFQTDQLSLENWPELKKVMNWSIEDKKKFYQQLYHQFFLVELVFENKEFDLISGLQIIDSFFENGNFSLEILKSLMNLNAKTYAFLIQNILKSKKFKNVRFDLELKSEVYHWIHQLFANPNAGWQIDFILDSHLVALILPEWNYISGLVQSDHYHKYTVSEHLRQTLKAVCALQTQPELRYSLGACCDEVTELDWQTLKWVALFHDLKKGHVEDHSILGRQAVDNFELFSEDRKQVVGCLVEHHLRLSTFAFRYEHTDQAQLQLLNDFFEVSQWIRLLLIFTGADIMGSNPQAWNKWKSDQLYFAYKSLMDFRNNKITSETDHIAGFDIAPYLIRVMGKELLQEDLLLLNQSHKDEEFEADWLVEEIDSNLWVRVYMKDRGPGTLGHILNILYLAGLPVEQAFISTGASKIKNKANKNIYFIYNWFRLPSTFAKPKSNIQKRIMILSRQKYSSEKKLMAQIDKVLFLTENEGKLSFLFKGRDQNGVLLYISKIFESLGVDILKAQINTWGYRIEDLFVVKKGSHIPEKLLNDLQESLKIAQSIKI